MGRALPVGWYCRFLRWIFDESAGLPWVPEALPWNRKIHWPQVAAFDKIKKRYQSTLSGKISILPCDRTLSCSGWHCSQTMMRRRNMHIQCTSCTTVTATVESEYCLTPQKLRANLQENQLRKANSMMKA